MNPDDIDALEELRAVQRDVEVFEALSRALNESLTELVEAFKALALGLEDGDLEPAERPLQA